MNSYYEAHITMLGDPVKIQEECKNFYWFFSKIDGDPALGDGIKCYLTRQFSHRLTKEEVLHHLLEAAENLEKRGIKVVRKKVELVIYDSRSSLIRFNCDGACPECHTEPFIPHL